MDHMTLTVNIITFIGFLLSGAFIVYIACEILFDITTVENSSMAPTLLHGDRLLIFRCWPARWLHRGQIVIVKPWKQNPYSASSLDRRTQSLVKRVVALPNDVFTTNSPLIALTLFLEASISDFTWPSQVWQIPSEHFFVKGDSAQSINDSVSLGPVPYQNLQGVVILKITRKKYFGRREH